MAHEPTKRDERGWTMRRQISEADNHLDRLETTYEDLNSVELGQTAKGEPQIKSVKVYGATHDAMNEAAAEALEVFRLGSGHEV